MHDEWTDAELAAANDPLFASSMPRQPRKRKQLDTRQYSVDEQIAAALEEHRAYMDQVLIGVIAEVQSRFKQQLEQIQTEVAELRTELEVQKRVSERMVQVEPQRHYPRAANGHA